ncbi:hypothetical protein FS837_009039 [Tulasnella sp. UAMH 9824]|nr:hypothetical protein FS837_009039 [Tulasnella sp. UAMH 9824]
MLLDRNLSGRKALAPTFVFPSKTYDTSDGFSFRTAVLQVLPTPHMVQPQQRWPIRWRPADVFYTGRVGSVWLVDAAVTSAVYLLFSNTVGVGCCTNSTPICVRLKQYSRRGFTLGQRPHELVIQKKLSTNTFTLKEGWSYPPRPRPQTAPSSGPSSSILPDIILPPGLPPKSSDRNAETGVPSIHVAKEVVKEVYTTRKPTSIQSIPSIGGISTSNDHGHIAQRRTIVTRTVQRPNFVPSIPRVGSPPTPAVDNTSFPNDYAAHCHGLEILRLKDGYSSGEMGHSVRPLSNPHLTGLGDDSGPRQREFIDGHMLNLLRGSSVYHLWTSYPSVLVFGARLEIVTEWNNFTFTNGSFDIAASTYPSSTPGSLDVTTLLEHPVLLVDVPATPVQLPMTAYLSVLVAPNPSDGRSSTKIDDETVLIISGDDVQPREEGHGGSAVAERGTQHEEKAPTFLSPLFELFVSLILLSPFFVSFLYRT